MTPRFVVRPLASDDTAAIAALHHSLFEKMPGLSIAKFGPEFLEKTFYPLNRSNPAFHCDVVEYEGRLMGFTIWTMNRAGLFHHLVRRHPIALAWGTLRAVVRRPRLIGAVLANVRYLGGERLPKAVDAPGWLVIIASSAEARSREFEQATGGQVAAALFDAMEAEMRRAGCDAWIGVVHADNKAINQFLIRRGLTLVHRGQSQGMEMVYYRKDLRGAE